MALFLIAGCLATPIDESPADVVGTWQGDSSVRRPVSFDAQKDVDYVKEPIHVTLAIHEDGSVTGSVGGAALQSAVLKKNRGELGRSLNIATNYLIADGYLDGPIVSGDSESRKEFTIPFNIRDGQLVGSIMWTQSGKYPSPLAELQLDK